MDRVVGSTASKTNSSANNSQAQGQSTENRPASALASTSARLSGLTSRAMLPPPRFPTVPNVYGAPGRSQGEISLSTICADNTTVEDLINGYVNHETLGNTKIEGLPNGHLKLHLPISTTDAGLHSYFVFQCQGLDLGRVTELNLSFCTKLTGQTLQLLSEKLVSLRELNLTGCSQFNDMDLKHVAHMANLDKLCLAGCIGISKQGFEYMTALLDKLETLDLTGCTQVNDDVLSLLPNMVELKHLVLSGCTGLTGDGLGKIGKAGKSSKLRSLTMDQCPQIADADLGKLRTLSQLEQLNIRNCPSITKNGINKLSKYLTSIKIESDFSQDQENRTSNEIWQGALRQAKRKRLG